MPSEFRLPLIVGGAVIGLSAIVAAVAVLSPEPPPTTTYEQADGQNVTVSWDDYPASAGTTPEEAIAAPREEDVEARWAALRDDLERALGEELAIDLALDGDAGWYPSGGNGYGGQSLMTTYNSQSLVVDDAPDSEDWPRLAQIVDTAARAHGLGAAVLLHESGQLDRDPSWRQDLEDRYGSADPADWWDWYADAYQDGEWLSLAISDLDRDPSGRADDDAERLGLPVRSVSISYGATVVREDDRAEFEQAIEPFRGLKPPPAVRSD